MSISTGEVGLRIFDWPFKKKLRLRFHKCHMTVVTYPQGWEPFHDDDVWTMIDAYCTENYQCLDLNLLDLLEEL